MELKAVATDVDRTLTDDNLLMDLDAIRTIRLLEAARIPVILSSGRDATALAALAPYLGTSGTVVAEDGAVVGRFGPSHYHTRVLARPERVREALAALREEFGPDIQVVPVPSRVASVVLTRALDPGPVTHFLREKGLPAQLIDSGLSYELADVDVNKGTGLVEAAASLGIRPEQVAAVGDSPNDIDMFAAAGWSAAVGSASDEVKGAATFVASAPHGQGFCEAVRAVILRFRPELAGLPWPAPEPGEAA
ncbi:MAG: phosphoglycolate phosphatase [Bacillota bacterium]|nr:MAG: phosphoglycolate phosphatase [Bacillota bacterium]